MKFNGLQKYYQETKAKYDTKNIPGWFKHKSNTLQIKI